MKTIKVIDLLNKIANDKEVPNIIIVAEDKHYYNKDLKEYINQRTGEKLFEDGYGKHLKYFLNDEVEIIEDYKKLYDEIIEEYGTASIEDNKIEHLKLYPPYPECTDDRFEDVENKINEIIVYLNNKGE